METKDTKKLFKSLGAAKRWKKLFNGINEVDPDNKTSTLKEVWETMQVKHFPLLAVSTRNIWIRRYRLLQELENLQMAEITSSKITSWVEKQVKYFKSDDYELNCRGKARRCNLDNELNLFVTIFNWYKASEDFEYEAERLLCPIKTKHKKLGFIRPKPVKNKKITLDHALKFFNYLKPLYRDVALFQYYTASRIGEVAGLQWNRIDFDNKKVTVMETAQWDMQNKTYVGLNSHPKNKEPRVMYLTNELEQILKRRLAHKIDGNNFVFHVEGKPLNYGTIQLNYREAQRRGKLPYSGTHILRHGMATLARKVGGGPDAVIAMTGHKDFKLADYYSQLDSEFQEELSKKIMKFIEDKKNESLETSLDTSNVISLAKYSSIN